MQLSLRIDILLAAINPYRAGMDRQSDGIVLTWRIILGGKGDNNRKLIFDVDEIDRLGNQYFFAICEGEITQKATAG